MIWEYNGSKGRVSLMVFFMILATARLLTTNRSVMNMKKTYNESRLDKSLKKAIEKATTDYEKKVDHFIASSLGVPEKPSLLTKVKFFYWRVKIIYQNLEYPRQAISIYKGKKLIAKAEFNIKRI